MYHTPANISEFLFFIFKKKEAKNFVLYTCTHKRQAPKHSSCLNLSFKYTFFVCIFQDNEQKKNDTKTIQIEKEVFNQPNKTSSSTLI